MDWRTMLAHITGGLDDGLRLRNEYLLAENRVLRAHIDGKPKLTDPERKTLAEIGKELGRKALAEVATLVTPETILGWHRKLIAQKFDGSKKRGTPGRPSTPKEIEDRSCASRARTDRGGTGESWARSRTSGTR